MSRKIAAVLCILALIFALSAHADSSWKCEKCGRRVQEILGDVCPYCGARRHVHTWREATCTEPKTCTVCGETEGEALGHQWDDGRVIKTATCQETGERFRTCRVCGFIADEKIPKDPYNHVGGTELRSQADATCTLNGYTGDTYCKGCGELIRNGTVVLAHGHRWDKGRTVKDATCHEIGEVIYACTVCGLTRIDKKPKDAENHTGGTETRGYKEATCTSDGYTGDTYCKGCGELIAKGRVAGATGHQWDEGVVIQEATCRILGVKRYTCMSCGASRDEIVPKDSGNHSGGTEVKGRIDATCTSDGYTGDVYCKDCGELIVSGSMAAALGHQWDAGIESKAATCRETGLKRYTCVRCGATREETIQKNPANHDGGTEVKGQLDAACTSDGYTGDTYCKGCGELIGKGDAIPALGHSWRDATYTTPKTCTRCGATEGEPPKKSVEVSDIITFGHYPQTASGTDSTPIEWLVLDRDGEKALLLSKCGLDAKPYNTKETEITWEQCSLRKWLNGEFLNAAFRADEQRAILLTHVDNSEKQGFFTSMTNSGSDTEDRVFLLSYAEANRYLGVTRNGSSMKALAVLSEYAKNAGVWTNEIYQADDGEYAWFWWLRSPGFAQSDAAGVNEEGSLSYDYVSRDTDCVRPAMWVNLEALKNG